MKNTNETQDFKLSEEDKTKLARIVLLIALGRAKKESLSEQSRSPLTQEQQKRIESVKYLLSRAARLRRGEPADGGEPGDGGDLLQ